MSQLDLMAARMVASGVEPWLTGENVFVGTLILRIHIPTSESLKAKRQVVKSVTSRLANQFGVAAAEVGENDVWQITEIGVAAVANDSVQIDRVLGSVVDYVTETRPDLELLDVYREVITVKPG